MIAYLRRFFQFFWANIWRFHEKALNLQPKLLCMIIQIEIDVYSGHRQAANNIEKTSQGHEVLEVSQQLLSSGDGVLLILLFALLRSFIDLYTFFVWLSNVNERLDSIILSLKNIININDDEASISSHSNEARIINTHIDSGLNISLFSFFKTKFLAISPQKLQPGLAFLPCGSDRLHGATFGILFCVFRI